MQRWQCPIHLYLIKNKEHIVFYQMQKCSIVIIPLFFPAVEKVQLKIIILFQNIKHFYLIHTAVNRAL